MWMKLPFSSKPPSSTMACQWETMGAPSPQEFSERLKAEQSGALYGGSGGFGEIPLDEIEDEPTHLGEELSVVPEKHSQAFWQTERHESVWKTQEKIILRVLGEEEHSFLGTGRTVMKAFEIEGTKELLSTFRIGALYADDSLGIIAAGDKMLRPL